MPARTTVAAVKGVLIEDYDSIDEPSLTPFIDTAASFIRQIIRCATRKGFTHDEEDLELIERWIAAHCYAMSDQPYKSRSNLRASGAFQGETKMYFEATKYGQMAVALDESGCLGNVSSGAVARAKWGGRRPSEQTDYKDRD